MSWLSELFFGQGVAHSVLMFAIVIALGIVFGKVKVWGISLGITWILFVGIICSHFGMRVDGHTLHFMKEFGLILFVYSVGLQVGPGFFSSFRKGGLTLNMLATGIVLLGVITTYVIHVVTGLPMTTMVGILSGAVTNTPGLGAAQQAYSDMTGVNDPTIALGYAVAYPLGVVGVILAVILVRKLFASSIFFKKSDEDSHKKTVVIGFLVSNPGVFGKTIQEIARQSSKKFVVSRLWRNEKVIIPASDTMVKEGDCLLMITTEGDVEALTMLIGKRDTRDWNKEDIDWDAIDSQLVSHRIVITRSEINGKRLGALRLRNQYGINITRIYRAGIVLLPTPDLTLQLGDRLTVVGEESAIAKVENVVGNAVKDLDEPNLVAVFIGMVLGLLLGSIPLTIPGISFPVKLGLAGGPIVMGILVGAFGPRIHMVTYTTISANLMLRALGLSMYLACLGLDAGTPFFETVFRPEGALWVGLGFAITVIPVILVAAVSIKWMKIDFGSVAGMLCGSMSNPMALNYVNSTVDSDTPSVAYATVYPLTMFVRVIMAQVILMLFL